MDRIRKLISERIAERGLTLKEVSLELGKNHAYLQQFIDRGVPSKLNENVRLKLSEMLDLDEGQIGGVVRVSDQPTLPAGDVASLEIRAGMGNGGLLAVQADDTGKVAPEFIAGHWSFPDQVKAAWKHMPQTYAFPVVGDSMSPTLESGSFVFVDTSHQVPVPEDIYVCDYGDGLMVKRLAAVPQTDKVKVMSDSDRYSNYELERESVMVFGRVVAWFHWRG